MLSRILHIIFSPVVVIGILFVSGLCTLILTISLWQSRSTESSIPYPTAILQLIEETNISPLSQTKPTETVIIPTLNIPNAHKNIGIIPGSIVQVVGTGGDGLRLRSSPGLDSNVEFLAIEGETYRVEDGPELMSGYEWWYLVATIDENVKGWAVDDFLVIYPNP